MSNEIKNINVIDFQNKGISSLPECGDAKLMATTKRANYKAREIQHFAY